MVIKVQKAVRVHSHWRSDYKSPKDPDKKFDYPTENSVSVNCAAANAGYIPDNSTRKPKIPGPGRRL